MKYYARWNPRGIDSYWEVRLGRNGYYKAYGRTLRYAIEYLNQLHATLR
jgi:hypothetical protein